MLIDDTEQKEAESTIEIYLLVRAARYLGVKPWELAEMPVYWRDMALCFDSAERIVRAKEIPI